MCSEAPTESGSTGVGQGEPAGARSPARESLDGLLDPWVIFDAVRDAAGAVVDFRFVDVNTAACTYFDKDRRDLIGHRLLEQLPGHAGTGLLADYAAVVDTGTPLVLDAFVYPYEFDDGAEHLYDIRAIRVGEALSLTWRDVTERVAEQRRVVETDARYQLLAENASDVVVETDADGRLRWVSPSVERVLGWSPADLIGTPAIDLLAAEDVAAIGEVEAMVRGGHLVPSHEVRCRTASGELRWMDVHAQPLRSEAGTIDAAVMGLRDAHAEVLARRALTTLSAGNAILVRAENEDALLAEMCETAVQQGGYLFSWYGRAGADEARTVEPVARARRHADYLDAVTVSWDDGPLGQGPAGTSIRTRRTTILEDASLESYRPWFVEATSRGFRSAISLPVEVDGQIDGAFIVYAAEPHAFDDVAVSLLEDLAAQLGYGLNRLRERAQLDRALGSAVDLLAAAVEARDPYTAGHQARVAQLAVAIGEALGFDAHRLEGLACGATIHDLGKNAVPIAILNRPGRLAPEETALVRRHAAVGWEIANRFEWPWPIAEMIHQHHERLDGSGYPQGLAGEEILLEARIIAVADVFEAAGSDRPYRQALGFDRARAIVVEDSDRLFDPEVVAAFERVLDDGFRFEAP